MYILHSLHHRDALRQNPGTECFYLKRQQDDTQRRRMIARTSHNHTTSNIFYRHSGKERMRGNRFWQRPGHSSRPGLEYMPSVWTSVSMRHASD